MFLGLRDGRVVVSIEKGKGESASILRGKGWVLAVCAGVMACCRCGHRHSPLTLLTRRSEFEILTPRMDFPSTAATTIRTRIEETREPACYQAFKRGKAARDNAGGGFEVGVQRCLRVVPCWVLRDGDGVEGVEADEGDDADCAAEAEHCHEHAALTAREVERVDDGKGQEGGEDVGEDVEGGVEEPAQSNTLESKYD